MPANARITRYSARAQASRRCEQRVERGHCWGTTSHIADGKRAAPHGCRPRTFVGTPSLKDLGYKVTLEPTRATTSAA
jgi:hypothetical protein